MMQYAYISADSLIIRATRPDTSVLIIEPGMAEWAAAVAANPAPYAALALPDPIIAERAAMVCTRMQGVLALGESRWAQVMAYRDTATWAEQIIIDSASDWRRNSENIAFFAYMLNLSATEVDDLFRTAMAIQA